VTRRYFQNPDVAWRRIRGKDNAILVLPRTCTVLGLSPVATTIWERLEAGASREQLVETLLEEYDTTPEVLSRDLDSFLGALEERGLVRHEVTLEEG
jgi:hypothetical protein